MSRRNDSVPVRHMLDATREIMQLIAGKSRAGFEADVMLNGAVQHLFVRIGRHASRVTEATQQRYPDVPWQELAGYGDALIRDYDKIDQDTLWRHATVTVPALAAALEHIVPELLSAESAGNASRAAKPNGTAAAPHCRLEIPREQLAEFCHRNHIRRLSFFGSVLRDDFGPASDVDVLVEFEEGYTPGLAFFGLADELGELLGRKVDLLTPESLSPYFRDEVLAEAEVQYAQP